MRRCWVFHSRLVWGVVKTYLLRPLKMSSRRSNKMLWERTTETSRQPLHRDVVGCFIWDAPATSLGRTERPRFGVVTTFCCWMGFYLLTIGIEIFFRSIPLELFLGKVVLKTCCKFTGEHPCNVAKQLYWNHTLGWVLSCKFAAYFQNTFSRDRFWRATPDS